LNQVLAQVEEFRHDWQRRSVAFTLGAVDTLTGGVLHTRLGRYLLMGPASLLLPDSAFEFSGYYTQTGAYRWGTYAGQAVNIALTLWNPAGAMGTAVQAVHMVQMMGSLGQAADAIEAGKWDEAAPALLSA